MTYVDQTAEKNRNAAIIGVVAIHSAIGYALVSGLAVDFVESVLPEKLVGKFIPIPETVPPPPPEATPEEQVESSFERPVVTPIPPIPLSNTQPDFKTTEVIFPPFDDINVTVTPGPIVTPKPASSTPPKLAFDPIGASPRNNPGNWVSQNDYRPSWINREMTGTAKFAVEVSPAGRVESCRITQSSGHSALDQATCNLVKRRARFDPAKNGNGEKVGGSYTNSVRWQLPD